MAVPPSPGTSRDLRAASLLRVLRAVHDAPAAPTRAVVTRLLGVGRGTATVLVAELKARHLLAESGPGARTGPGRPTACLVPHPQGPLVLAVAISHDGWTLDAVQLGGAVVRGVQGRPDRSRAAGVLTAIAGAARTLVEELPGRVGALAVSLPATVHGGRAAEASRLGWGDVDVLAPFAGLGVPAALVNDATAAGLGEARRGLARGHRVVLHLHLDAGIGGVLLLDGSPAPDAHGAAGEFGHLPLGRTDRPCPCGASGCWDLEVGNLALAGADGVRAGGSARRAAARVLARARAGDPDAVARVDEVVAALGRGIGGLVNAHDPDVVTLSGSAGPLAGAAPEHLRQAYLAALMRFRRAAPPPVLAGGLGERGQRVGTAERAVDLLLTEALVRHGVPVAATTRPDPAGGAPPG